MGQNIITLDRRTNLAIGYDPRLRSFFAHLWIDDAPAGSLGLLEPIRHPDDLMAAIPGLLADRGLPSLTEAQSVQAGEAAIRAKGGPDAMLLDLPLNGEIHVWAGEGKSQGT